MYQGSLNRRNRGYYQRGIPNVDVRVVEGEIKYARDGEQRKCTILEYKVTNIIGNKYYGAYIPNGESKGADNISPQMVYDEAQRIEYDGKK